MLEKLRKINMQTAVCMGICFYSLTILLHVLIISSVIPFTWVNGGRSDSFAAQLPISITSIVICILGGVFTLFVGGNTQYKHKRLRIVCCWVLVVFWSFWFFQQLLGTPFEKMVCSLLLILGIVSNLRMAIEKDVTT
ncbi:hypothetical protein NSQ95_03690 [Psychrobacillus sp. FSL W7-1457]|uniref:hypothetical protein n=1 Tax=Psychrobacillus sp. FSL W7-1457 TaxID=2954547 RepID=UPI003159D622